MGLEDVLRERDRKKDELARQMAKLGSIEDVPGDDRLVAQRALADAQKWSDLKDRVEAMRDRLAVADEAERLKMVESLAGDKDLIELLVRSYPKDPVGFELPSNALDKNPVYKSFNEGDGDWSKMLSLFSESDIVSRYRKLSDAKKVMTYLYLVMVENMPEPTRGDLASEDLQAVIEPPAPTVPERRNEVADPQKVDSESRQILNMYGMSPLRIVPGIAEGGARFGMGVDPS